MSDGWSIVHDRFDPKTSRASEGLLAQGSGYLHVRGSLEEHLADEPQNVAYNRGAANVTAEKFPDMRARWGTYVPGIFGKHPVLNNEMVNLPWFLDLCPVVAGEKLDMVDSDVSDFRRELDLRSAVLRRTLLWRPTGRGGKAIRVEFERFLSSARKHVCVQKLTLRAEAETQVEIRAGIDGDIRTNGYDHLSVVKTTRPADADVQCDVTTDRDEQVTTLSRVLADGAKWSVALEPRRARLAATLTIPAGGELTVVKLTAVATSRDLEPTTAAAELDAAAKLGYAALLAEHEAVWSDRWAKADVQIGGDARSQLVMRCSIYHLLRCHCPDDPRVAIDAKGAAGEAYYGRYFWDTEMNLLPFYLYTHPAMARTLVDFRRHSLDGARRNARGYGYQGARYAWESDSEGNECCAAWQYRDHEVHVTADVVYGMVHYARAAESDYCQGPPAAVLAETARYWLGRIDWRKGEDGPSLLGVMGPDEYCPISHNNSYTNRMVSFALATAGEFGRHGGASDEEAAEFASVSAGLKILRDPARKLVLQCEDFELLAEPQFDRDWADRSKGFANHVSQERLYRTKCLKQADVLMLMMLFPTEFSDEEVRAAWDYYLPYTTHDSSLSAGVHAIVACRLGLVEQAWEFWQLSAGMDLDGHAAEGIHIAGAGNNWQMAVMGFAGLTTAMHTDVLKLRPHLPKAWKRLAFPLVWKGCPAFVEITRNKIAVTNRGDRELNVCVDGQDRALAPGATETFE